jgi:hypothetical protein
MEHPSTQSVIGHNATPLLINNRRCRHPVDASRNTKLTTTFVALTLALEKHSPSYLQPTKGTKPQ